ncbi:MULTISPECIES: SDR family NAD(P)-dependent oxidoreductase [unclassified Sphingomonas]|uniref:SDR family NAD(P)-dependent oxidoreductase n=1 Tax=Novosphingobium rhizosphaerae TaxID=1551649 RepID=UPI0015CEB86A
MTDGGRQVAVFGASGGIGAALVAALAARDDIAVVHAGARRPIAATAKVRPFTFDYGDEPGVAQACEALARSGPLDMVLVATGQLTLPDGSGPEKSVRGLRGAALAQQFAVNTIGPALVMAQIPTLLPRDRRGVFAVLSARVGSISDNRLGGWHGYRAAKAALNMLLRGLAIELARSHPQAVAAALHPGTVDTALSAPFQRGVSPDKLFTPDYSANAMLAVLNKLKPADSGKLWAWDGAEIPF